MRLYHLAPTRAQAVDEAAILLQPFIERMRKTTASMQPAWTPWFEASRVIEDSLVGTAAEIREKALQIEADLGPRSLVLEPISADPAKRRANLEAFAQESVSFPSSPCRIKYWPASRRPVSFSIFTARAVRLRAAVRTRIALTAASAMVWPL